MHTADAFPGIAFEVHGTPKDADGARDLAQRDKYQFQWWACSLVNAPPYQGKKKGADSGIDGLIFFQDEMGEAKKIIVSVKGGENVNVAAGAHTFKKARGEKQAVEQGSLFGAAEAADAKGRYRAGK